MAAAVEGSRSPTPAACWTPPRLVEGNSPGAHSAPPAPSPDTAVKSLISAIDVLQQQQERAEAARHAAEQAGAAAAVDSAAAKVALHAALQRAAELDDEEQAVQSALDARLQEQAALVEQLRLVTRRLGGLRAEPSEAYSTGAADSEEAQHKQQLQQKQLIAEELRCKLLAQGLDGATLAQLCSDAAAHSTVQGGGGGGSPRVELQAAGGAGWRKASWLGGASGGVTSGGGLLSSFTFRRRANAS